MEFVVQREEGWRQAEEGRRQAEGANKQLIIDAIEKARARTDRRLDEIDDTPLVEKMQRMRLTVPRTVRSRTKAADLLKHEAKGAKPDTTPDSKRRRLFHKHKAQYPGTW
jgi:hypothetical protein